jgi:hypothetical protein
MWLVLTNFVSIGRLLPSVLPLLLMLYKMILYPKNSITLLMCWIRGRLNTLMSYGIFPSLSAKSHLLANISLLHGSLSADLRICYVAAAIQTEVNNLWLLKPTSLRVRDIRDLRIMET